MAKELKEERMDYIEKGAVIGKPIQNNIERRTIMASNNKDKQRRLKMGIAALVLIVLSYALAKITNDISGDWWKFSLLTLGVNGFIGGYLTLTDIYGKRG